MNVPHDERNGSLQAMLQYFYFFHFTILKSVGSLFLSFIKCKTFTILVGTKLPIGIAFCLCPNKVIF